MNKNEICLFCSTIEVYKCLLNNESFQVDSLVGLLAPPDNSKIVLSNGYKF